MTKKEAEALAQVAFELDRDDTIIYPSDIYKVSPKIKGYFDELVEDETKLVNTFCETCLRPSEVCECNKMKSGV